MRFDCIKYLRHAMYKNPAMCRLFTVILFSNKTVACTHDCRITCNAWEPEERAFKVPFFAHDSLVSCLFQSLLRKWRTVNSPHYYQHMNIQRLSIRLKLKFSLSVSLSISCLLISWSVCLSACLSICYFVRLSISSQQVQPSLCRVCQSTSQSVWYKYSSFGLQP